MSCDANSKGTCANNSLFIIQFIEKYEMNTFMASVFRTLYELGQIQQGCCIMYWLDHVSFMSISFVYNHGQTWSEFPMCTVRICNTEINYWLIKIDICIDLFK